VNDFETVRKDLPNHLGPPSPGFAALDRIEAEVDRLKAQVKELVEQRTNALRGVEQLRTALERIAQFGLTREETMRLARNALAEEKE
jgi:hypothetical protein